MDWLSTLLLSIIASLAAMVIWEKVAQRKTNSCLDEMSLSLLNHALKLLPDLEREIYEEEWFMFLCDQTSAKKRMLHAMLFAYAAIKIRAEVRLVVPITAALAQPKLAMQQFKFEPANWRYMIVGKLVRWLTTIAVVSGRTLRLIVMNFISKREVEQPLSDASFLKVESFRNIVIILLWACLIWRSDPFRELITKLIGG